MKLMLGISVARIKIVTLYTLHNNYEVCIELLVLYYLCRRKLYYNYYNFIIIII